MVPCLSNLLPLSEGLSASLSHRFVCDCVSGDSCAGVRAEPHQFYLITIIKPLPVSSSACHPARTYPLYQAVYTSSHFPSHYQFFLLMLNPVLCFPAAPSTLSPCPCPQPFVSSLQPCYASSGPPPFPASSPSPSYSALLPSFPRPAFHSLSVISMSPRQLRACICVYLLHPTQQLNKQFIER